MRLLFLKFSVSSFYLFKDGSDIHLSPVPTITHLSCGTKDTSKCFGDYPVTPLSTAQWISEGQLSWLHCLPWIFMKIFFSISSLNPSVSVIPHSDFEVVCNLCDKDYRGGKYYFSLLCVSLAICQVFISSFPLW